MNTIKRIDIRFGFVSLLILMAALSRLLPHPHNFSPIGGMALFGAAYYNKRYLAYLIPILAMWISDLLLNNILYAHYFDHFVWFYSGSLFTYAAFALMILVGSLLLKNVSLSKVIFSALSASVIFYLVSNLGVWITQGVYPHTWEGLLACYVAALPFFQNTLAGDILYSGLLFGVFKLCTVYIPQLQVCEGNKKQRLHE